MELETYFEDFAARDWERADPDGTVRIAVVGVGGFASQRAIPAMQSTRYCDPTVLVSGSPGTQSVAENFGIETVVSYDAFLEGQHSREYDAVYVATPNALHARYAIAAARMGKHVICEKPLATPAEDAWALVEACRDAGVTLMTAYRLQLEPAVRRTRELIADGAIGDLVQFHAAFSHPLLEYTDPGTWRLDPSLSGGGALIDLGIYSLNTIRFLAGREPNAVTAITNSVTEPFAAVDEHVAFQLSFPGGLTASCTASFNAHASSTLQAIGTEGIVKIGSPFGGVVPQDIYVEVAEVGMEHCGPPIDEVREEFAHFGYCVLTGTTPDPDGRDGARDVEIIEDIYMAAERGERVDIAPTVTDPPPG